jgi:hypothetical protein
MEIKEYTYISSQNQRQEDNIIIFIEEIILNILKDKNPILIFNSIDYKLSGKNKKKMK